MGNLTTGIKKFLQNKNSTHMQHMNACDIWKINN